MAATFASTHDKSNQTCTNVSMTQLRQKLNNELKSLNIACCSNMLKDKFIREQQQRIQALKYELQIWQSLNTKHISTNYDIANVTNE